MKLHEIKYIAYCRKSSEDKHRQIASIEDQQGAVRKIVDSENLNLVRELSEERSAKDPGRPVFNEMLDRIEKGEANGIVCWAINRLYRNPVDEGRLRWMLQKGIIKVIKTPSREFYPEDAGLLMGVEGGQATDYVIRLSKDVKRGLGGRVAKGWRPGLPPLGYLNTGLKGEKVLMPDPLRYETVRKIWDLFLTGVYSVSKIQEIATNEWGLRTAEHKRLGGKPVSMAQMYRILSNEFYYGYFYWNDYEKGEKYLFKGEHQPMVTEQEFQRAQVLLGKKGKPQPKTKEFAFTGLMKCGECDSAITAEEKNQIICTSCKHKFGYEGKTECSKCHTDISKMQNPTVLHYIYYRCTKKKNKNCSQKYVRLEEIEEQFNQELLKLKLDEDYLKIALDYLHDKDNHSINIEAGERALLQKAYDDCQTRLNKLQQDFNSPQNIHNEIYTLEEFRDIKKILMSERGNLLSKLDSERSTLDETFELTERTFNFCTYALYHFNTPDLKKKRAIFSTIGSNLILKDKKLIIERLHPFILIENEIIAQKRLKERLELKKSLTTKEKSAILDASSLTLRRR